MMSERKEKPKEEPKAKEPEAEAKDKAYPRPKNVIPGPAGSTHG